MEQTESLSEKVQIRMTPTTRAELEQIAARNPLTNDLAKHIRLAIDEYIERQQASEEVKEPVNA